MIQIKRFYKETLCLLFFVNLGSYAQFNYPFLKHLSNQNLSQEHKTYLQSPMNISADSVYYFKAKYYLQYFNDSLFLDNYSKSKVLFNKDTNAVNLASIAFLTNNKKDVWFSAYSAKDTISRISCEIFAVYQMSKNANISGINLLPEKLQMDLLDYKKYYARKPILAAALSTFVPGLGEIYAGKKRSFPMVLLANLAYAAQAYEAYYKLGVKNPFSVFSVGFFGAFYFANIYGSYYDLKQVKKEKRKQFLIDAAGYYNINCSSKLYE